MSLAIDATWVALLALDADMIFIHTRWVQAQETVEITIIRSRDDYRRFVWEVSGFWKIVSAGFAIFALGSVVAAFMRQWLSVGVLAIVAAIGLLAYLQWIRREIRHLPDWAFAPVTFRLFDDGIELESAVERRLLRWPGIRSVSCTDIAWYFIGENTMPVVLHRRTLSEEQDTAIEEIVNRHSVTIRR